MSQTVLTTGANSGIGLATVLEVARKGYHSVGSVRSEAKAEDVRGAARKAGVKVDTILMDVTNSADCRRVMKRLMPYALVNNAGFPATGAVEDVSDREARLELETMVIAPIRLARLALPHMRAAGEGRIINMSSIYGVATTPLSGWYQAAKHALEAVSDALRMEVADTGVKVVLIEPGGVKTGIWEENKKALDSRRGSHYETAYSRTLRGSRLIQPIMAEPETIARVVVKAISGKNPRARYLVGYDAQFLAAVEKLAPALIKDRVSRMTLGL